MDIQEFLDFVAAIPELPSMTAMVGDEVTFEFP